MARVIIYRLGIAFFLILTFWLLWSLAYEIVVGLRWAPQTFPGEGVSKWALLRQQNADRSSGFAFIAVKHVYERLLYAPTRTEALIRAGYAALSVLSLGIAALIFALINRKQMPYGAAKFGTLIEAAKQGLTKKHGIILGTLNGVTICSDEPAHILVVGPSRSGKGTGFVLPNGYLWQGSAVFFDPKRENFHALAPHRHASGNLVFMFSPGSPDSHRYNPLDFVRRDERMATDCLIVASFVIPEKADDTWAGAGRLLLAALIGYVLASPLTKEVQHMRTVARMTTTGRDISAVLKAIVKTERGHLPAWVIDSFNQYIALEPETRNSAVFNVNMAMSLWNNGLISAATETSDFDIRELRRTEMTIFIGCTIAELAIFRPLIRILFQQIHDLLMEKIPGPDEPHQVLLMLDEFYHVGRMDSLVSKITISAGYGFRMALIMQDIAQLDELYGKNKRITIVSGSQIKLFIQINDLETSDFVSDMLGKTTQIYKTPVVKPGQGIFAPRVWAPHYASRPLRSALELREMSARHAILMVRNSPSFELTKIRHYLDKPFVKFHQAVQDPPRLPLLRTWIDEPLGGAFGMSDKTAAAKDKNKNAKGRTASTNSGKDNHTIADSSPVVEPALSAAIAMAQPMQSASAPNTNKLKLGDAPERSGESCDVRAMLAATQNEQAGLFKDMINVLGADHMQKQEIIDTKRILADLQSEFGDDEKNIKPT